MGETEAGNMNEFISVESDRAYQKRAGLSCARFPASSVHLDLLGPQTVAAN